jgi:hypothetical protein
MGELTDQKLFLVNACAIAHQRLKNRFEPRH